MDYVIKNLDPEIWKKARIKAIKVDLKMMQIIKRLIEMWANDEVEVKIRAGKRR
jgi:hypothetical protein